MIFHRRALLLGAIALSATFSPSGTSQSASQCQSPSQTQSGSATAAVPLPDYRRIGSPISASAADPVIAQALGQVSASQIQETIQALVGFHNRNTLSSMDTDLPPGTGITAAADWLFAQFERISRDCGNCLEVHRDTFTQPADVGRPGQGQTGQGRPGQFAGRVPRPTRIANVFAVLRGADPAQSKRVYLVTGHYDSRNSDLFDTHGQAPGANDDASGVAVSLECARVLSKLRLPATLVFAAVAGEEQGLLGSAHLAQLAKDEGWQIEGALNNDIVGGDTTPGDTAQLKSRVRVFSEPMPTRATPDDLRRIRALGLVDDSASRQLARAIADAAQTYTALGPAPFSPLLVSRPDRYLRGGDHTSFNKEGFAAVRFTEWRENFNHQHQNVRREPLGEDPGIQYGDLPAYVDFSYVAQVTRLNAATLATLASAPGPPANVAIDAAKLENSTVLGWEPTPGATRYQILWRETDAPDWQFGLGVNSPEPDPATGRITVTLPISKDNVLFGVRAIDAGNHRGLVAMP